MGPTAPKHALQNANNTAVSKPPHSKFGFLGIGPRIKILNEDFSGSLSVLELEKGSLVLMSLNTFCILLSVF